MVTHNESAHRFDLEGGAYLTYTRQGDTLDLIHTFVPPEMRGKGAAGELAKAALDFARAGHLSVIPTCPSVKVYLDRHPEYQSLVSTIPTSDDQV